MLLSALVGLIRNLLALLGTLCPLPYKKMPAGERTDGTAERHGGSSRSPVRSGELAAPGSGGVTDVNEQVAAAFASQLPIITKQVTVACTAPLQQVCATACEATVQQLTGRMVKLEEGQAKLEIGQDKLAKQLDDLSQKVTKAMDLLSHSSSAPNLGNHSSGFRDLHALPGQPPGEFTPDVTTSTFYRKPDPTKLFLNTRDQVSVSRDKIFAAVVVLAGEAGVSEEHFDLQGDALDNRFELLFKGTSAPARALQFYQSLQLGRGKWKVQQVLDDLDEVVQFFVQPDKNGAQIRREVLAKNLKAILGPMVPGKEIFVRKTTGSLLVDRRVLATVFITGEQGARIQWFHPKRIDLAIEQSMVEDQFAALVGGPSYS